MALSKVKKLPNGVGGSYWKITSLNLNVQTMTVNIELSLFAGRFASEFQPLVSAAKIFIMPVTKETIVGDLRKEAYTFILAQNDPDLVGATSV